MKPAFSSMQWLIRGAQLGVALAVSLLGHGSMAATAAVAEPVPCEVRSLRAAIQELSREFGPRYAGGARFLARLEVLERRLAVATEGESAPLRAELAALQSEALTANPLVSSQPILFVARQQFRPDHHNTATFFPKAHTEYNNGAFTPGAALKTVSFAQGKAIKVLLDWPAGVIRDPEVHFDGQRILFSLRKSAEDSYHLYELSALGTGLRQLTFAEDVDDLDPVYLPDDSIGFSSTREPKYCMCNRHIMANLFRMEGDGANIHQIGKSTLFEGHASLLPDGRLLYDRWEYVDRNFGDAQALWTMNPDGSNPAVYWGNNTPSPGAVIDARAIPGTMRTLCVFGSCHDRPWGALAIIDRQLGLDGRAPVVRTWPEDAVRLVQDKGWQVFDAFTAVKLKYEDPYPLSDKFFLCSRMTGRGEQMGLYLIDVFGNEILLHSEEAGCFDPMPLGRRERPPVLPTRRDFRHDTGRFYVADVYTGTAMKGVERGGVKWLRVVESPEKRSWTMPSWDGQGQEAPAMNWHDFNNKRILGTVPVEADGSAYFEVPADTFVYFQLLDQNGMLVQSMRSGTQVQSGEQAGCVGCHEDRRQAPTRAGTLPLALRRSASQLTGWYGPPRLFSYRAEVQPVLDRHCVKCHDFGTEPGVKLNLAGDRDLTFNTSYNELWRRKFIQVVGAGPAETQPAYSWGSTVSKLGQTVQRYFVEGKISREERDRVVTWIDVNAPYYPAYSSAYPTNLAGRSPLTDSELARLEQLTGVPLRKQASHGANQGPQVSFDRPALSPCLRKIPELASADYQEALALIQIGQRRLAERPEADAEGFKPCAMDEWREQNYLARRKVEQRNRSALTEGRKVYDP